MADKESVVRQTSEYTDIMEKNHMEIPWHDYAKADSNVLIAEADLIEKASVIGRVGLMMLSCGTGAWRVLKKCLLVLVHQELESFLNQHRKMHLVLYLLMN